MCFGGAEEGNVGPGSHHQAEVSDWPWARGPGRVVKQACLFLSSQRAVDRIRGRC